MLIIELIDAIPLISLMLGIVTVLGVRNVVESVTSGCGSVTAL